MHKAVNKKNHVGTRYFLATKPKLLGISTRAKKIGAQTTEANSNAGVAAANQIVAFFEKGETTFQVNKEKK